MIPQRFYIKNAALSIVNLNSVLRFIDKLTKNDKIGYICVTNSRTVHLANHNKDYCEIQNNSLLSVPDGAPLVWIAHNKGLKTVGKVSGKDLMDALFQISVENNYSHYFFGSTPQTINLLQNQLKKDIRGINIKGAISPPFQPLEEFDIESLAKEINRLKPTFFWCGLGAPKQERFIAMLQPKLEKTICIGVGLAFEYVAGTVKRAPLWMQKSGLEWSYRLRQQPQNISRAIRPLSWILVQVIFSSFKQK